MTRAAVVGLGLALCLCTGCFVFDEIDQGREMMKKHSGQNPGAVKKPEPEAEPDPSDAGIGLLARVQQWIQDYREPAAPVRSADDQIVSCELPDGHTFTYESDCLSRGGAVL